MDYYKTYTSTQDAVLAAIFNNMSSNGDTQIFAEIWPDAESRENGYSMLYGPFSTFDEAYDMFDGNYSKAGCAEVCIGDETNHKCIYYEDREGNEGWYIPTLTEMNILVNVDGKYFISSNFVNGYTIDDKELRIRQYSAVICEFFEDLLDRFEIDIPSKDRNGDPEEARIYGEEYSDLEDQVTEYLAKAFQYVRDHPEFKFNTEEY